MKQDFLELERLMAEFALDTQAIFPLITWLCDHPSASSLALLHTLILKANERTSNTTKAEIIESKEFLRIAEVYMDCLS